MQTTALDLSPAAENIPGFLLWQVSKLWQRYLNAALKDLKLSSTQAVILGNVVRLTKMGHEATQAQLSQVTKIDTMTTSTALRGLVRKGMVVRHVPNDNRRAYIVTPTKQGERVAITVLQRFAQAHAIFFRAIEEDIDGFAANLQILRRANDIKEVGHETGRSDY